MPMVSLRDFQCLLVQEGDTPDALHHCSLAGRMPGVIAIQAQYLDSSDQPRPRDDPMSQSDHESKRTGKHEAPIPDDPRLPVAVTQPRVSQPQQLLAPP